MSAKVLALGPPSGDLTPFLAKVRTLQAKHTFSFAVVLGDFFGPPSAGEDEQWEDLLGGRIDVPLTTYITCGEHALPSRVQQKVSQTGGEVCSNLFYIGNSVLKTSEGLKIGSLSTLVSPSERNSFLSSPHLPSLPASSSGQPSLAQLQQAAKQPPSEGLDILLLPSPPTKLFATSPTAPAGLKAVEGDGALEEIVRRSHSRYILFPPTSSSSSDDTQVFFEREPFPASTSGTQSQDGRYSRAIQLGRFAVPQAGSTTKPVRSFYAFNLSPLVPPFVKPANATMNPFLSAGAGQKREREALEDQGFIWGKMGGGRGGQGGKRGRGDRQGGGGGRPVKKEPIMMAECWFCLSNPKVTKHLITSIGEEVYVTLPKGPLVAAPAEGKVKLVDGIPQETGRGAGVPGGGHVLIIPISHHTTIASIPDDEKPSVNSEIGGVIESLRACYKAHGMVGVGFEVGRLSHRGGHAHIQFLPLPLSLADKVEPLFKAEGAKAQMVFEEAKTLDHGQSGKDNYFRLILPDGKQLVAWMGKGVRFDLQFGRSVLANLLGIPGRLDWKACLPAGGEADEKRDATAFKKAFGQFDGSA